MGGAEVNATPNEPTGVAFTELLGVDRAEATLTCPRWVSAARSARRHAVTRARSTGSRHARTCTAADASRSDKNTPAPSLPAPSRVSASFPWYRMEAPRARASLRLRRARAMCAQGRPMPCAALGGAPLPWESDSRSSASDQSDSNPWSARRSAAHPEPRPWTPRAARPPAATPRARSPSCRAGCPPASTRKRNYRRRTSRRVVDVPAVRRFEIFARF